MAVSLRVSGVLLTFSFLVMPPVTALMMTKSMRATFLVSAAIALISALLGVMLSYGLDLPTGPSVVGVNFLLFLVTAALKRILALFSPVREPEVEKDAPAL